MSRRTVLITGGARGIGAAIAKEFAQAGDQIAYDPALFRKS